MKDNKDILLKIQDLRVYFRQNHQVIKAVNRVSFDLPEQEILALVGESGCGKTVTALAITKLIPPEITKTIDGKIIFKGEDLLELEEEKIRKIRGGNISYVFQEPKASLNPVLTVGEQIVEAIELHQNKSRTEACTLAMALLKEVGLSLPQQQFNSYPHQLSGGMNQRVMIALALSSHPELLIADEPTTALDVSVQAQILKLLLKLKQEKTLSILFITHNLKIVKQFADRVAVMYAGKIVEILDIDLLSHRNNHPYTLGLLDCIPTTTKAKEKLRPIKGRVPSALSLPSGCLFHPRCPEVLSLCERVEPKLREIAPTHWVACHRR